MKIKYIISTHKNYHKTTLKKLIPSLLNEIEINDIFVVAGGYETDTLKEQYQYDFAITKNNSFDLTALIEVVKYNLFKDYDYIFLFHDTCEVLPGFKEKVESYINEETITIGLWSDYMSSNIGLYKRSYLMDKKDIILSLENKTKLDYIKEEDCFLKQHSPHHQFFGRTTNITGYENIYSDNVQREINVCNEIGLLKYKANWKHQEWVINP